MSSELPENTDSPAVPTPAPSTPAQAQTQQIQIDDSNVVTNYCYTNFCRVTGTPEELIIDFGLNPQPVGIPTVPIPVTQRVVTNYYTAKRLLHALMMTLERHERAFGVLEVDVQKRARGNNG